MLDGSHLDDLYKLAKLAESDESDSSGIYNQSAGFQAVVLARNGKREQARAVLARRVELSLQILSDDVADNDALGFSIPHKMLELYQDFQNAAIALSLLVRPDLATSALDFEADKCS
ncbi:uncharacterized protein P174DRAFT_451163 [Aspergillus novofumigatus IBT 16806]|uniref:Uncharacterized protein n=1 Tax=Aspergillus novofumigatus (strain IBT 16806) TaxID=1392255 RepID=A0A2I1C9H2_ASPN1|nr:uncharacterized protein P174DRAFT_451163 [Aspergillus novofumigatus IBT 16806]PKX94264.1 hypothetical protein P174DRAFT_451163 [Aspergillus novofumigatus IBT 16806]